MTTARVNFRLPEGLVERTDLAGTVTDRNRTEVVTAALVAYLDALEAEERYREALTDHYLDGEVDFEALHAALGRRDAEAVRASKALLDRGDELAETLETLDADRE